ncbi:hypothetical protein GCM10023321_13440 [Pseudonocardia eucalypti]|uniref:TNase-like domain-containing protein n=1 Tax=Pseudonocardia eucalypti TaxID=648755 RepID=A0ABP9PTF1_9PSEU
MAAAAARMRSGHAVGREIRRLSAYLRDGESVRRLASGIYGPAIGLLAVTDQRVLVFRDDRGGQASEGFPLTRLSTADWELDGPTGTITLSDSKSVAVLRDVSPTDGAQVLALIRSAVDQGATTHMSVVNNTEQRDAREKLSPGSVNTPTLDWRGATAVDHHGHGQPQPAISIPVPVPDAPPPTRTTSDSPELAGERSVGRLATRSPTRQGRDEARGTSRPEPTTRTNTGSKSISWRQISPPTPADTTTHTHTNDPGADTEPAPTSAGGNYETVEQTNTPHRDTTPDEPTAATPTRVPPARSRSGKSRIWIGALAIGMAAIAAIAGAKLISTHSPTANAPTDPARDATNQPIGTAATVTKVIDAETVEVTGQNVTGPVTVLGIVTPKMDNNQCGATTAKAYALKTLTNMPVTLVTDPSQPPTDKAGRTQAFLRLADGGDYSVMAVRAGMARHYNSPHPVMNADELQAAEQQAKHDKLGLWDSQCDGKRITSTPSSHN